MIRQAIAILFVGSIVACSASSSSEDIGESSEAVSANPYVACGNVLKKKGSTENACYDGVCAKSNGHDAGTLESCGATSATACNSSSCGYEWQCVELVNRYMHVVFGNDRIHGDAGCTMCNNFAASSKYTVSFKQACGGNTKTNTKPVPGDAIVWAGHTAVVTMTNATSIHFMEQNAYNYWGTDSVPWTTSTSPDTFGSLSGMAPACVIHEKSNVCTPGELDAADCSACRHQTRVCSANHTWGAWGACQPGC